MFLHFNQDGQAGRPFTAAVPKVCSAGHMGTVTSELCCCVHLKVNVLLKIMKELLVLAMYLFHMIVAISD
jgi:hypothetical protein